MTDKPIITPAIRIPEIREWRCNIDQMPGGAVMPNRYLCHYRRAGFFNCHCARFDDGSCVPPHIYPEFSRRRDDPNRDFSDRSFANRRLYENSVPETLEDAK